ncbi:Carcinoembryonic antigen-related cell adhesion molecule 5 [Cricetulus griseus]|uniref:Carcinoembryonic antigen-related cell adhesion molecule 5 n=1 Tax=Cricetulus griseus TaxID=10029 RepID=G3ILQ6_CRIGR|nr:Carcinoembryonic antigen-related cell adhesion molecule 5 [Cricetulus griseus]
MALSSVLLYKGYTLWQGFLLTGFLFTCGRPHPFAPPTIELVPPNVTEGENVLLLVHNLPMNLQALFWYKGLAVLKEFEIAQHIRAIDSSVQGPAHSGREALFRNGSLMFYNVLWKDNGFYTLRTLTTDLKTQVAHVQLQVDTTLSTCCRDLTSAQVTIESMPRYVAEGGSVLLLVHNLPEDLRGFSWYKSLNSTDDFKIAEYSRDISFTVWGLAHSQRDTVYTNGSLLLQDVTNKDAGWYMLETFNRDWEIEKAYVQLHVNKPVTQPFVRLSDTTVTVQSSVVLTCFSADPGISTRWILNYKSLQLTERMKLSPTKCQLTIDPVRREDAGEYQSPIFGFKKHATPSKPTVELVPPMVAEEDNVLFLVRNLPEKLQGFAWHKGVLPLDHFKIASHAILINSSMLAHKYYGRATIYTNGSLLLQNVTQKDTGIYTLRTISADLRSEWAIMHLQVNSK